MTPQEVGDLLGLSDSTIHNWRAAFAEGGVGGLARNAPHHPMMLGKIERFWRTIWEESLSEAVFASFAAACQRLDHWIHYYNHQRPHQGLDGACPADRLYGLAADVDEALRQGCQDNALRLALGQQPRPPLYLLGQMGGTEMGATTQHGRMVVEEASYHRPLSRCEQ